ncbi:MAG: SH3 domain-containing protein [Chloroflexi bacterium]|nr:SH3 domain-containing protein [Chloroflexota bacterium]MBI3760987.1 SH3 domain-containing protein [Chloroflexota bacterium]
MRRTIASALILLALSVLLFRPVAASPLLQLPTETLRPSPTLGGPFVEAIERVNLRTGPGTDYDLIGVLIAGQPAAALGRSPGGTWIEVYYPGAPNSKAWVFADLVKLNGTTRDKLPTVEPPPTPTLQATPTLGANLTVGAPTPGGPTHVPSYTPPPPYIEPTFLPAEGVTERAGFPPALLIIGLFLLGMIGLLGSFFRLRR